MPLLIPLLGLFGITAAVLGGERLASNIPAPNPTPTQPAQTNITNGVPWYITGTAVLIGGVLIYKYGAKKLHV